MTVAYSANTEGTGETLSVSDGTTSAGFALLGQYPAAGFQLSNDGQGGALVTYTALAGPLRRR